MDSVKNSEFLQLGTFLVGNKEFAVNAMSLREIIRYEQPTRVPCAESFVEGAIDFRGTIVPVINLRERFGLPPKAPDSQTRIVNVEVGDMIIGFVVDSMGRMRFFPTSEISPPPSLLSPDETEYVLGVCSIEDNLVLLVDLDKMFPPEFLLNLAQI